MRIRHWLAILATRDRDGFAMPVVLFTMVVMTILAVAAIDGSVDQQRSSAAVRRSGEAFYAAETGLNVVHAEWADTSSNLDSLAGALASGGSLDLGWDTLPSGAVYHAELMRIDEAGQALFLLTVAASDRSGMGGGREVSLLLTSVPGGDGAGFMLGECCDAAVILKGDYG
ncbi:MAG: pilus assembly PilX N-terminal domain-containing protein, partial [Gemmatimonadetes bacterium]|nr:pilus assembly PilX N-terminal domain-containing protein [Gemmatimonadota bacterium]